MPSPSSSLSTLRPELSGSFEEFSLEMNRQGLIGYQIMPILEVEEQSGSFGKLPIEQLLQTNNTKRAPGAGYNRGDFKFETDSYATEEHGWEEPVDDREARMYRHYFDAEMVATSRAFQQVLLAAESRIASAIFNTSTWSPTSVTNEWDDATNATPIDDVEARVQAIYDASGVWPDTIVMTQKVFRNLRNCDQVINRINSAGAGDPSKPGDVTRQMIAELFDLPKVLIGNSTANTAKEGQSISISPTWSNEYVWIGKTANSRDVREPCVGRTFHWSEDGSSADGRVESYREEQTRSDIIRVRHDVDEKVIYTAVGALLDNITT